MHVIQRYRQGFGGLSAGQMYQVQPPVEAGGGLEGISQSLQFNTCATCQCLSCLRALIHNHFVSVFLFPQSFISFHAQNSFNRNSLKIGKMRSGISVSKKVWSTYYQTQSYNYIRCYGSWSIQLCIVYDILPSHKTESDSKSGPFVCTAYTRDLMSTFW